MILTRSETKAIQAPQPPSKLSRNPNAFYHTTNLLAVNLIIVHQNKSNTHNRCYIPPPLNFASGPHFASTINGRVSTKHRKELTPDIYATDNSFSNPNHNFSSNPKPNSNPKPKPLKFFVIPFLDSLAVFMTSVPRRFFFACFIEDPGGV